MGMTIERPKQASDLRYFSRKTLDNGGKATVWVFAPICPQCKTGRLIIPYDEEAGRYKSRSKEFSCNSCNFRVPKNQIKAETPIANVDYVCPHCSKSGEKQDPFVRSAAGVFKFKCEHCGKEIKVESGKSKAKAAE